jgi:outer membrane protein OmpA-like peptidoglycan-associated protein
MRLVKTVLLCAFSIAMCSGCGVLRHDALLQGEPIIEDKVFLLHAQDEALCGEKLDGTCAAPDPCKGAATWRISTQKDAFKEKVKLCTLAMKLLIDTRWAHFADELRGAVDNGTAAVDLAMVGLNSAAALAPTGTAQILSAIAGGLGSAKATVNQDILYKNSITLILLQMKKDRASWATVIMAKLNAVDDKGYQNMYEAANDLYAYDRAGSWNEALAATQVSAGAQTAQCEAEQKQQALAQAGAERTTTDASKVSGTTPCETMTSSATMPSNDLDVAFGAGKSDLDSAARDKIAEAVARFKTGHYSVIEVTGLADASGDDPDRNNDIAKARGDAVVAALDAEFAAATLDRTKIKQQNPVVDTRRDARFQKATIKLVP